MHPEIPGECPVRQAAAPRPLPWQPSPVASITRLEVRWAGCEEDVRAAQRLRYRVFAHEMGARLTLLPGTLAGLDADRFDPFCDHLLVHAVTHECCRLWPLVGTYRALPPAGAQGAGGFYTDTEFDLSAVARLRGRAVELGRACVHPAWRSGGVIMALWTELGRYMRVRRLDTMLGCASVRLDDGGQTVRNLWYHLRDTHLAAPQWHVRPRIPLPLGADGGASPGVHTPGYRVHIPALVKGYLRCGARLLGPPALDAAFNAADLPMILRIEDLTPRYRKRFLGD